MEKNNLSKHSHFYCIGLSYKKAEADIRGTFSLNEEAKIQLLEQAKKENIKGLIAISTCNRTEIYGFAAHPYELIKLLCDNSQGNVENFQKFAYIYKNHLAINHLFKVGTGLDSQILGDFEIISQLKTSFNLSKTKGLTNAFLERLINAVIQTSKRIKNETKISSGATSVSFASVQYILNHVEDIKNKNILLFGTGKIGRNTCENLIKHTKNDHITLINRTKNKAEKIAGKFNLTVKDFESLSEEIQKADVLIVATGASIPTINKNILKLYKPLLILDLSIPKNVNENVQEVKNVSLIHLDQLTQITDETLDHRKKEIPAAELIINKMIKEFQTWTNERKFAPTIHALKEKLNTLKDAELSFQRKKTENFHEEQAEIISKRIIQKITTHFANHLKDNETLVDESIELIEKIFQIEHSKQKSLFPEETKKEYTTPEPTYQNILNEQPIIILNS